MSHSLLYFAAPGRAFVTRVCFGAAGVKYENKTLDFPAFQALKATPGGSPELPLGSVPVLTLPSGRKVVQSAAMARYAATLAKMYGSNPEEALLIDEVCETANELLNKCPQLPDAEAKKAAREAFARDTAPKFLSLLESRLEGRPFYGGATINLADLTVFAVTNGLVGGQWDYIDGPALLAPYPGLTAHVNAVKTHPLVVAHGQLQ